MKIWYMRGRPAGQSPDRTDYLWQALAAVWADEQFRVVYTDDFRGIARHGWRTDVAIVCGGRAARALWSSGVNLNRQARLRIFVPDWHRSTAHLSRQLHILQRGFHAAILNQRMYMGTYQAHCSHVYFVDRGFAPTIFYPAPETEKTRGIVFCGNINAFGRLDRLAAMHRRFPGQVHWTTGLRHWRMAQFLRTGRIGWNQILRVPGHGVGINYRVWEVLGSGLLLLCNRTKDVTAVLQDGIHCVLWDSDKDLLEKAEYYLAHDEERQAIAHAGYEEALAKHTWRHRALEYKRIVEELLCLV